MKEIDQMLKQWIPVNTIIREKFRKIIIKEIEKERAKERIKMKAWEKQLKNLI
tara:strand:+ start:134 stop:292 length:159 start_codon:yes stop_codon:yes gene_type:complete